MSQGQQRKRKRSFEPKGQEELELEQFLFGTAEPEQQEDDTPLSSRVLTLNDESSDSEEEVALKKRKTEEPEMPAWHDEDDDVLEVNLTKATLKYRDEVEETTKDATSFQNKLREQHAKVHQNSLSWAHFDDEEAGKSTSLVSLHSSPSLRPLLGLC